MTDASVGVFILLFILKFKLQLELKTDDTFVRIVVFIIRFSVNESGYNAIIAITIDLYRKLYLKCLASCDLHEN